MNSSYYFSMSLCNNHENNETNISFYNIHLNACAKGTCFLSFSLFSLCNWTLLGTPHQDPRAQPPATPPTPMEVTQCLLTVPVNSVRPVIQWSRRLTNPRPSLREGLQHPHNSPCYTLQVSCLSVDLQVISRRTNGKKGKSKLFE